MRPSSRTTTRALGGYGAAAALSLVAAFLTLQLWRADLRVPFTYGGDALFFGMQVKSIVDHGWYLDNPQLGGPGGLQMYDFPTADNFHLVTIKLMSLFSHDWALLFNLYFLLAFPLITLSALAVFRHFRVNWGSAVVGSLLFAFLPSRLLKGEAHIFLGVFYQVPLATLVVLWVCGGSPPLVRAPEPGRGPRLELSRGRSLAAVLICALTASMGLYYAFFTACLLLAGGLWASIDRRSTHNALAGAVLAAVIVVVLGINGLPTVFYQARQGSNPLIAARKPVESEMYSAKITQLLLPVDGHRIQALRHLKIRYAAGGSVARESSATSLGILGSVGFLALLGLAVAGPRPARAREDLLRPLAVLNLMALLLGTTGGFGSLFALLVTPQLRAYVRISVLIGFLAIFALVLLLERLERRHARLAAWALPLVLIFGLLDQATPLAVPEYASLREAYRLDADFVRRIEASVPPGSMIFELPYMIFPEGGNINQMFSYDMLRPYLHSTSLGWSFPAMRGRAGDAWVSEMSLLPPREMLERLSDAGAGGVVVDRFGYADGGLQIETALRTLTGAASVISNDQRMTFYDLAAVERRAHAQDSPDELERKRDRALHPVFMRWGGGFFHAETDGASAFRWASADAEILVDNQSGAARQTSLAMALFPARLPARLTIDGDLLSASIDLTPAGVPFTRSFDVPRGRHVIRFHCDGQAADAPSDPRSLYWRAVDPVLGAARPAAAGPH